MSTALRDPQPRVRAGEPVTPISTPGLPRRILLAEDDHRERQLLRAVLLEEPNVTVDAVGDGERALALLGARNHSYSMVVTDLKMPGLDGLKLIRAIQELGLPVTIIVMTGYASIESAVQAMRLGACDFLTKPIDPEHLRLVVRRALRERALQDEVLYLREQSRERHAFHDILSKNRQMHAVFELIEDLGNTTTNVLIEGATGTGKEMVARAIHQASCAQRRGPFVAVNCAALPETLLESELFGHEKGAFTGAVSTRAGRFEAAHGGTLFLDELDSLPLTIQPKLLRVLQHREIERLGGSGNIKVDVRLLAATGRPLAALVRQRQFRKDLYYRINVVRVHLPCLGKRAEDIPLLAAHFAVKYARPGRKPKAIAPQAMQALLDYHWPGNVRELENVIERACVISSGGTIGLEDLPAKLGKPRRGKMPYPVDLRRPLHELTREALAALEHDYIKEALATTGGNVSRCAVICGLSRRSLTAKIKDYHIDTSTMRMAHPARRPRE